MSTQQETPRAPEQRSGSESGAAVAPNAPRTTRDLVTALWSGWPFGESWVWPEVATGGASVPVRVEELVQNDQVVVRAELPGVQPEDIEVVVEGDVLTITAQRQERTEDRSATGYRSEFRYGRSSRQVRLPEGTSAEVVSATYSDGVLEVRMPAPPPRTGARRIEVERG